MGKKETSRSASNQHINAPIQSEVFPRLIQRHNSRRAMMSKQKRNFSLFRKLLLSIFFKFNVVGYRTRFDFSRVPRRECEGEIEMV